MPKSKVKKNTKTRNPKKKPGDETLALMPTDIQKLEQAFDGDQDLALFFLTWIKNDRNATKAYKELHPKVDDKVASVLGARKLGKVRMQGGVEMLLESYGVGFNEYFLQLKQGLEASTKKEIQIGMDDFGPVFSAIDEPDHATRRKYHQALGRMIGLEGMDIQINNANVNQNNNQNLIENLNDEELDDLIS